MIGIDHAAAKRWHFDKFCGNTTGQGNNCDRENGVPQLQFHQLEKCSIAGESSNGVLPQVLGNTPLFVE